MASLVEQDDFLTPILQSKKKNRGSTRTSSSVSSSTSSGFDSPTAMGCKTAAIPASPFMQKLGCGTGVAVYLFQREGTGLSPWAVKKTFARTSANMSEDNVNNGEKMLLKEAQILKNLNHENIVGFRAISRSVDGRMCLSMENGEKSLLDLIEVRDEQGLGPFPASQVYCVALGIARALQYLHCEKHLLHGDLKSGNVLVIGNFESVKLCDFNVTLKLKEDDEGLENPEDEYIGTEPWSAPEVISEEGPITDKTDVFSYALVLWEMLALTFPHLDLLDNSWCTSDDESLEASFYEARYQAALGTRPPLPAFPLAAQYNPLVSLFWACTEHEPSKRPSTKVIVEALESIPIPKDVAVSECKENTPME